MNKFRLDVIRKLKEPGQKPGSYDYIIQSKQKKMISVFLFGGKTMKKLCITLNNRNNLSSVIMIARREAERKHFLQIFPYI